jgi:hypothetical protein
MVRPRSSRSRWINRIISWVSQGFIPAVGSSSSNNFGSVANARAISKRR